MSSHLTLTQRFFRWANNLILTSLVPLERPSRFFSILFKTPLLLYRLGLGRLVPEWMLLLTTTGRRTGKLRQTMVEFLFRPETGACWVMSGWAGNTDWYKNARAHPEVGVQIRSRCFKARAVPLTEQESFCYLQEILRINPGALQIFSRWAGRPLSPDEDSLRACAPLFPGLALWEERTN